jgi:hypothetical protein
VLILSGLPSGTDLLGGAAEGPFVTLPGHRDHADILPPSSLFTTDYPARHWPYCRFTLSERGIEYLFAEHRLDIAHRTVRRWVLKFGWTQAVEP